MNMGNRARKKYIPGGPDGPVFKVNFANENFETFFLVEERGMVSYVTLLKKMTGTEILNELSRIFRSETYFGVPIGQMSHRWNRLPRIHCWND